MWPLQVFNAPEWLGFLQLAALGFVGVYLLLSVFVVVAAFARGFWWGLGCILLPMLFQAHLLRQYNRGWGVERLLVLMTVVLMAGVGCLLFVSYHAEGKIGRSAFLEKAIATEGRLSRLERQIAFVAERASAVHRCLGDWYTRLKDLPDESSAVARSEYRSLLDCYRADLILLAELQARRVAELRGSGAGFAAGPDSAR